MYAFITIHPSFSDENATSLYTKEVEAPMFVIVLPPCLFLPAFFKKSAEAWGQRPHEKSLRKLAVIKFCVEATLLHECFVVTCFDNVAILHDQNEVCILDG